MFTRWTARLRRRISARWSSHRPIHALSQLVRSKAHLRDLMAPAALSRPDDRLFQHDEGTCGGVRSLRRRFRGRRGRSGSYSEGGAHPVRLVAVVPSARQRAHCGQLHRLIVAAIAVVSTKARAGGSTRYEFVPGAVLSSQACSALVSLSTASPQSSRSGRLGRNGHACLPGRRRRPPGRVRTRRDEDQSSVATASGGTGPRSGRCLPRLLPHWRWTVRYVRLLELLPAERAALLGAQEPDLHSSPSPLDHRGCRGVDRARPAHRAALPMTVGLLVAAGGLAWLDQIGVHTNFWTCRSARSLDESWVSVWLFRPSAVPPLSGPPERDCGRGRSALVNTTQQIGGSRARPAQHPRARPPRRTTSSSTALAHPRPGSCTVSPSPLQWAPGSSLSGAIVDRGVHLGRASRASVEGPAAVAAPAVADV